jgi:hypothetical protein
VVVIAKTTPFLGWVGRTTAKTFGVLRESRKQSGKYNVNRFTDENKWRLWWNAFLRGSTVKGEATEGIWKRYRRVWKSDSPP